MKKIVITVLSIALLFACQKTDTLAPEQDTYITTIAKVLKDSLPVNDFATLDFINSQKTHVDSANVYLLRVPIVGKNIKNDFLIVKTDGNGKILKGTFITINRVIDPSSNATFNGTINYRSLTKNDVTTAAIINGHIKKLPENTTLSNKVSVNKKAVQDLPEVIVYSSYSGGGISYGDWYNLLAMLSDGGISGGGGYYVPSGGGGGGGGGGSTASAVKVDFETPENKAAIDPKKYIDCFGRVADAGATFTVSIATDIPVDNDPSKFFNWTDASPGHTYIELYKNGTGGLIQQNFGFYPNSAWKTAGAGNVSSKIVDDAGHEYNARYSISVTAAQFQAALNAVQSNSTRDYNIGNYNCTDFALSVFNAAGGGLSIPKYAIPSFPNPGNSNTPQGVYNKLQDMSVAGTPNIDANGNKAYGGTSHGACN